MEISKYKYDEILKINNIDLTKKYIASLNREERELLIEPIFKIMRNQGFSYPDNKEKNNKEWKRLLDYQPDLESDEIYNNSSLATYICRFFCRSFYEATEPNKPTMIENFNDDKKLRKMIYNRLGLDWYTEENAHNENKECFNMSVKMICHQSQRSLRLISQISMFKPIVAKYIVMKYSHENDLIHDYSCGFGARMLGALSSNRRYIGTDPLTVPELEKMAQFFDLNNYTLIHDCSETWCGEENSIDLSYSSPPYFSQEVYAKDESQAYNKGEDYFYDVYWRKTLENVKFMLKPNRWFGLNVTNLPRMLEMAQEYFGEPLEVVKLKTTRSHLTKTRSKLSPVKYEPVYMFKNEK